MEDEKYQILHILFDFVNFDFKLTKIVSLKPKAEFEEIFRLAAPLTGWQEVEGGIFILAKKSYYSAIDMDIVGGFGIIRPHIGSFSGKSCQNNYSYCSN